MKYIGMIIFFFALFILAREHRRMLTERLSELRAFLDFVRHIRIEIGCYMSPPDKLCRGFFSPVLSEMGFLQRIESGSSPIDAYKSVSDSLSLLEGEREILYRLFSKLGDGYLEDTVKLIDEAENKLSLILSEIEIETPKQIKLASVLFATGGVGTGLLLI